MATTTAVKPSAPAALPLKGRPYRDFLTPSLHRRFTNAALIGLLACWILSLPLADPSWFWFWFPIGPAGIRTLLLFVSPLSIFVLRVSQLHFGQRTASSSFESFWNYALSKKALNTCFWYLISAFVATELYIFSTAHSANFAWIDPGRSYERPRLNERPIYFRSQILLLALGQSFIHLKSDYDLIRLPKTPSQASSYSVQLRRSLGTIALHSSILALTNFIFGPLIYFGFLRQFAWSMTLSTARTFSSLPKSSNPILNDAIPLHFRVFFVALALAFLWEFSNCVFSIYTSQEPVKKGKPLTADSKDPNASLISGLRAKKEIPKTIAFWELSVITDKFEDRRKTLYQDLDRAGGSTWSQILNVCLAEIQSVKQRTDDTQSPVPATTAAGTSPEPLKSLPKISQPLKDDPIYSAAPPPTSGFQSIQGSVGTIARSYGQSPGGTNPVSPRAQRLLEYGANKVLSKDQQEQLSRTHLENRATGLFATLIRTWFGRPFQQKFASRVNAVVFGSPTSSSTIITHAVRSICGLAVHSLKEDNLGQVQKDIKTIVRTLVSTIQNTRKFVQTLPPHWTDVEFNGDRRVKDVDVLLDVMKKGLNDVLVTFGEYADGLGLARSEVRLAKEIVGLGPEMQTIG